MTTVATRFGDLPRMAAQTWGEAEALRCGDAKVSFADLSEQIDTAARALLARGISKGDTVGFWVTNRIEFIIAFYATLRIGAIAAPMNTRYRAHDLAYVIRMAECKLLFVIDRSGPVEFLEILKEALPGFDGKRFDRIEGFPDLRDIVVMSDRPEDSTLSWKRFLAGADNVSAETLEAACNLVRPDDFALIVFTSGTTGNPKGVLHDHAILKSIRERHTKWPMLAGETTLSFLPMFHLFGMSEGVFGSMITGVRQVIMDSWDAELAVRLIEREKITSLFGFETHYADILRTRDRLKSDLSSLKFGGLPAGMENSTAVALQVQKELCPTVSGFGMSEIGCYVFITTLEDTEDQRCATSGRPCEGVELRVVNPDTGAECAADEIGEIQVRGYNVMRGYFRDVEATAATIDADGWLHTGDRGYLRADGFLKFLGRYKEMLKVGGENVSPAALEEELRILVPTIEQVAVVGVPDDRLSEVAAAYVVARPGQNCTLDDVQARCKGKIASFKIPRYVIQVDNLPMTASGKVQRVLLRAQAVEKFGLQTNTA